MGIAIALAISGEAIAQEKALGDVFIDHLQESDQVIEFYGQGSRPVDNRLIDRNSIYQNKNAADPTEFGAGIKINATDDFSISVEAGGEVIKNDAIEVDSGVVKFGLTY